MYEAYFGITRNPFLLTPDPSFLYLTESHREAYAGLMYAVTARKGFVVLTGEVGTGKTTLLHALLKGSPQCHFSVVLNPSLTPAEFLEFVMHDFGIDIRKSNNKAQRLVALYTFLAQSQSRGKTPVLVVDEAHRLDANLLEEIRLLTNFESSISKLLQIVLVGQVELDQTLDRPDLRQLKQRIAVRLNLVPLNAADVDQYIWHRWRIAGGRKSPFTSDAVSRVVAVTGGVPRLVNTVCDNALLVAFATDNREVTETHVIEAATDLHLIQPKKEPKPVEAPAAAVAVPAPVPAPSVVVQPAAEMEWPRNGDEPVSDVVPNIPRSLGNESGRRNGSLLARWFGWTKSAGF